MIEAPLVLVADDDEDILALVSYRLRRDGYDVACARDGAEALELARTRRPAVAVLDAAMPAMDGVDVVRALREEGLETRVVLLTARARPEDVRRGFDAGADGYITKPFSPAHLSWEVAALAAMAPEHDDAHTRAPEQPVGAVATARPSAQRA